MIQSSSKRNLGTNYSTYTKYKIQFYQSIVSLLFTLLNNNLFSCQHFFTSLDFLFIAEGEVIYQFSVRHRIYFCSNLLLTLLTILYLTIDVMKFYNPNILWKSNTLLILFSSMVHKSSFKWWFRSTKISFTFVMVSLETIASQNIRCETFFVKKTFISNPAIAVKISFTGIENFLVVWRYNRFHVSHYFAFSLFNFIPSLFLWWLKGKNILSYPLVFDPKTDEEGGKLTPCGFPKSVSSKEREKPWFFVTFNIILRHIFPENFIEFPQVVQKIWRNSLSILANFHQFSSIFWIFWHYLLTKKTNDVSL